MAAGDYAFGSFLLEDQAAGYSVIAGEPPTAPRTVGRHALAVRDGSVAVLTRYEEALGSLTVMVTGATFQQTEDRYDALLKTTARSVQALKLGFQDERYWLAEFVGTPVVNKITGLYYTVALDYVATSAHAYAAAASSEIDTSALANVSGNHYSKTVPVDIEGSIKAWPVITIAVPSGGPYGMTSIWVTNGDSPTLTTLQVVRAWAADEVLVIDSVAQSVTVDGVEVDYSGQFPALDPADNATNDIEIHCMATSTPTLEVEIAWRERYR